MILCELTGGNEQNPTYQALAISNGDRVYRFLESVVTAAVAVNRPLLSETVVKAFNYHAISCLHTNAGEYRPCADFRSGYNEADDIAIYLSINRGNLQYWLGAISAAQNYFHQS